MLNKRKVDLPYTCHPHTHTLSFYSLPLLFVHSFPRMRLIHHLI